MIQDYEFMLVLRPDVEVTDKNAPDFVAKFAGENVKVKEVSFLGKKELAYPIKNQKEGIYIVSKISGSIIVRDIEKRVQLGTEVLRFLLIVKE